MDPPVLNEIAKALNKKFGWINAGQGLVSGRQEQIEVRSMSGERFEHGFLTRGQAEVLLAIESENAREKFQEFMER